MSKKLTLADLADLDPGEENEEIRRLIAEAAKEFTSQTPAQLKKEREEKKDFLLGEAFILMRKQKQEIDSLLRDNRDLRQQLTLLRKKLKK